MYIIPYRIVGKDRDGWGDIGTVTGAQSNPTSGADARLIAAAPELLEACVAFVRQLDDALDGLVTDNGAVFVAGDSDVELRPDGSYLLSQARAAIAKATGK